MNDYYIYAFFRENCEPFYVGKGRGYRWRTHFRDAKNKKLSYHHLNIIRDMLNRGIDVPVVKLHQGLTNKQAVEYEIALIAAIGRRRDGGLLANLTTGGEGFIGLPPESRAKQAAALRGRKASPETKAKMSAARLGRGFSPERNKKVSIAKLGKKFTREARANMSAAKKLQAKKGLIVANLGTRMLGRKHSPETKRKMSEAALGRKMQSEACEKMRIAWTYRRARALQKKEDLYEAVFSKLKNAAPVEG